MNKIVGQADLFSFGNSPIKEKDNSELIDFNSMSTCQELFYA